MNLKERIEKTIKFIDSKCECEKITESDCHDCLAWQAVQILEGKAIYFCNICGERTNNENRCCDDKECIDIDKGTKLTHSTKS